MEYFPGGYSRKSEGNGNLTGSDEVVEDAKCYLQQDGQKCENWVVSECNCCEIVSSSSLPRASLSETAEYCCVDCGDNQDVVLAFQSSPLVSTGYNYSDRHPQCYSEERTLGSVKRECVQNHQTSISWSQFHFVPNIS